MCIPTPLIFALRRLRRVRGIAPAGAFWLPVAFVWVVALAAFLLVVLPFGGK